MTNSTLLAEHARLFPGDPNAIDQKSDVLSLEVKQARAKWLGARALIWGLPRLAPVACSLVEAELKNLPFLGEDNDHDSVGPYQQRDGYGTRAQRNNWIWSTDAFLREFLRVKGDNHARDDLALGEWIADAQRPAEQYRYRYATRVWEARSLMGVMQMVEIVAGTFTVTATERVNIREEPSTTAAIVGGVAAGATVTATGYTVNGQPYNGVTTWVRLGPGRWSTKVLLTGMLPPTASKLMADLSTCRQALDAALAQGRLSEAQRAELALKVSSLEAAVTDCERRLQEALLREVDTKRALSSVTNELETMRGLVRQVNTLTEGV